MPNQLSPANQSILTTKSSISLKSPKYWTRIARTSSARPNKLKRRTNKKSKNSNSKTKNSKTSEINSSHQKSLEINFPVQPTIRTAWMQLRDSMAKSHPTWTKITWGACWIKKNIWPNRRRIPCSIFKTNSNKSKAINFGTSRKVHWWETSEFFKIDLIKWWSSTMRLKAFSKLMRLL